VEIKVLKTAAEEPQASPGNQLMTSPKKANILKGSEFESLRIGFTEVLECLYIF